MLHGTSYWVLVCGSTFVLCDHVRFPSFSGMPFLRIHAGTHARMHACTHARMHARGTYTAPAHPRIHMHQMISTFANTRLPVLYVCASQSSAKIRLSRQNDPPDKGASAYKKKQQRRNFAKNKGQIAQGGRTPPDSPPVSGVNSGSYLPIVLRHSMPRLANACIWLYEL